LRRTGSALGRAGRPLAPADGRAEPPGLHRPPLRPRRGPPRPEPSTTFASSAVPSAPTEISTRTLPSAPRRRALVGYSARGCRPRRPARSPGPSPVPEPPGPEPTGVIPFWAVHTHALSGVARRPSALRFPAASPSAGRSPNEHPRRLSAGDSAPEQGRKVISGWSAGQLGGTSPTSVSRPAGRPRWAGTTAGASAGRRRNRERLRSPSSSGRRRGGDVDVDSRWTFAASASTPVQAEWDRINPYSTVCMTEVSRPKWR